MKRYGLIGFPLEHSFSPEYFRKKFQNENLQATYELFPIRNIQEFPKLIESHPDLSGLNVTIPHKQSIIPYLDHISDEAKAIGAVNTLKIEHKTRPDITGYNTDVVGLQETIGELIASKPNIHALILGTGGASVSVQFVLKKLGIPFRLVSRKANQKNLTYQQVDRETILHHRLIINTTPLGMHPHVEDYPILPYEWITADHIFYDLIYNPQKTHFLQKAEEKGAVIMNGLKMLEVQAEASWRIWNEA